MLQDKEFMIKAQIVFAKIMEESEPGSKEWMDAQECLTWLDYKYFYGRDALLPN